MERLTESNCIAAPPLGHAFDEPLGIEIEQFEFGARVAPKCVLRRGECDIEGSIRGSKPVQTLKPETLAPTKSRKDSSPLSDLHLDVFVLEQARASYETNFPASKHRPGISVAVRGQAF